MLVLTLSVSYFLQLLGEGVQSVRRLRKIVSTGAVSSQGECLEAKVHSALPDSHTTRLLHALPQFELGKLYVRGHYGGVSRTLAYQYLRQVSYWLSSLWSVANCHFLSSDDVFLSKTPVWPDPASTTSPHRGHAVSWGFSMSVS